MPGKCLDFSGMLRVALKRDERSGVSDHTSLDLPSSRDACPSNLSSEDLFAFFSVQGKKMGWVEEEWRTSNLTSILITNQSVLRTVQFLGCFETAPRQVIPTTHPLKDSDQWERASLFILYRPGSSVGSAS